MQSRISRSALWERPWHEWALVLPTTRIVRDICDKKPHWQYKPIFLCAGPSAFSRSETAWNGFVRALTAQTRVNTYQGRFKIETIFTEIETIFREIETLFSEIEIDSKEMTDLEIYSLYTALRQARFRKLRLLLPSRRLCPAMPIAYPCMCVCVSVCVCVCECVCGCVCFREFTSVRVCLCDWISEATWVCE